MNAKTEKLIADLATDLKEDVAKIEASPETTEHHYGNYGSLISAVAKGNVNLANLIGHALIKAGAHPLGVANAIKLFV